jgi:hypothetical protein
VTNLISLGKRYHTFAWLILILSACADPQGFQAPEDPLDASREFVRAVLDANFEKAEQYILPDADDIELFKRYRSHMSKQPADDRLHLKEANIIINKVEALNDTVSIVNFQNSWSNKPADLKVVQREGRWYIDFKYTFSKDTPE